MNRHNKAGSRNFRQTTIKLSLGLLLTLPFLGGCSWLPADEQTETLLPVDVPSFEQKPVYTVEKGKFERQITVSGSLMSAYKETLYYTLDNRRVKKVYVKPGDTVKKGQVLAELDMGTLEADIRKTELLVIRQDLMMQQTIANDPTQALLLKVDKELQKEELNRLKETLTQSKLTATISGTLDRFELQKGDLIKANEAVGEIVDTSELFVAAKLDPEQRKTVTVGMPVTVQINRNSGELAGTVKQLPSAEADKAGASTEGQDRIEQYAILDIGRMPSKAKLGTPLTATITVKRLEGVLLVPLSVLRTTGGRSYVVVEDQGGNRREADVEIGEKDSTNAVIVKGLQVGDKVIGR
ncbi:efflux RND transporter periplasmic adaptor subunit [Paenibacillus sp. MMS18-CY102]|uniref:efflux RND transporter periplasmic adaptor subunit n=1 Tax=Paenibacillus sp. MMS18-CY102 TaxID=2682849 RepID=UPI001365ED35|nr:efflux RND transporter periplasmic adaptor subunit [Paenibacillus sp. MMS18-CY102]MWC28553.1 HlyD family efflux transporter periplasmic adaptor subunit [Paenibacillus sp. MMS18-CY102]